MIDTHCHILPGADDGPKTMDGALRMAAVAARQGIRTIVATPHHATRRYQNSAVRIQHEVKVLNEQLRLRKISLRVLPGQEFHLTDAYMTEHEAGRLQTLAGTSYLLVELPSRTIPSYFSEFLAYMNRYNLHIIIAHPERNFGIIQNPDQLYDWMGQGILLQVTTQSLVGYFGRKIQKTAAYIVRQQWAHFLASDAHNTLQRTFYFRQGAAWIEKLGGREYRESLQTNAEQLIQGRLVIPRKPLVPKRKSKWL